MNNYLLNMTRRVLLVAMFLSCAVAGWAQTYQNGIRKGQIKVKFASSMTTTVSKMKVSARSGGLTTGIQAFDVAAKKASATNMYRLFPANSKNENKLHKHGLDLWYIVEIRDNVDPKMAIAQFKQLKEVAVAEPEYEKVLSPYTVTPYVPSSTAPAATLPFNDPMLKDQWHYNNTGQSGFGDADVNLFEAWKSTAGANNIVVSVHDQGIDVNHADLKDNVWVNKAELTGKPNVDDDHNGYIDDINGYNFQQDKGAVDPEFHGTHVAGTIAAINNNGIGVSGVAGGSGKGDGVKVMSLQIFGGLFENSYIYAADNGAVISQNSWGYTNPDSYDESIKDAIDYFIAEAGNYSGSPMKGGIVIFASGNSNSKGEWYPGYFSNVMAVSSIGPEWKKAYYSNYGNWVEISATGGDQNYNTKSGVLSTVPKNQYAYLQGTSMACPHMSGIAALALANRTKQMTNSELWYKLVTGVVNIDEYNPDYIGQLGSGAVDAALAIKNDMGLAPNGISNLNVTGITQEFATLEWSVPSDNDDVKPISFQLYAHTQPITTTNLNNATKVSIKNEKGVGEKYTYELGGLLGLTKYYFAVTSIDRWGNVSVLSNIVSRTTNNGPSIAVDEDSQSINLDIDVANGTSTLDSITILNNAEGLLRWNHLFRNRNIEFSYNAAALNYPIVKANNIGANFRIENRSVKTRENQLKSNDIAPAYFEEIKKIYTHSYPGDGDFKIIGETDLTFTNSSATRFVATESDGFNLTKVRAYLNLDSAKGPVIVEIYKGTALQKTNLVYAQEFVSNKSFDEDWMDIYLNEQLYFESGETFWVVIHVPSGNLFPLGMGAEIESSYSNNCFMSLNMGASWMPLEKAINDNGFVWAVAAVSSSLDVGSYLTLAPGSGDVGGNDSTKTALIADASRLINGTYNANLVLTSNDASQKELRVPVNLTVTGQQPDIRHVDIADFGSVFMGTTKTVELVLDNKGYGNFSNLQFSVNDPQFSLDQNYLPYRIEARGQESIRISFIPTNSGTINDVLTITNDTWTFEVPLVGMGTEVPKISISPTTQVLNNVTIGDKPTAEIVVENNGGYPLKYFVPGFDNKDISTNWPTKFHTYGYKLRSNREAEANPIPYEFMDIKATGVNITKELNTDYKYFTLDMGFDFPYYGKNMKTLYIAKRGFTTFDKSVNPLNTPVLHNNYTPRGYISPLGSFFSYISEGQIFYQVEPDRIIVQYDNVWDGSIAEHITAQMVLFANGDIRFYYDNMGYEPYYQQFLTILIEDLDRKDGILIHDFDNPIELYSGLALGLDYPGPNIITKIENSSGVIAPGSSATINISMKTDSLSEGMVNRFVNFISNDPFTNQVGAVVRLNIQHGGVSKPIVSTDTIAFGNVFQGAIKSSTFSVKNKGTANVNISSMAFVKGKFTLVGDQPTSVVSGLYKKYEVKVPTSTLATLEDWLSINYADGSHETVYVTAKVVEAPAINVDLSLLEQTLAYGDSISLPFTVENSGLGTLEVVTTGKEWLSFDAPAVADDVTYMYEKHNTGGLYQWFDIRKTGTHLPFWDLETEDGYWTNITLPFQIEYYGVKYDSFKIGDNGIISFEENPEVDIFTDKIPTPKHPGACIMPYWTFSGFNTKSYAQEDVGIFYQFYDDKIIITWSYFVNNFGGMGDPVSAQIIFYKNGTMKFQYKVEGDEDETSGFSSVGLQRDSTHGVMISEFLPLDHGSGLVYVVVPAKKLSVAPQSALAGQINLDARNVYGGVYNEILKIQTNVPGSENLEKPVTLTVTGDAQFTVKDTVDFGTKIYQVDKWGTPKVNSVDLEFRNDGKAPYQITYAQMADATQSLSLQFYALVWDIETMRWRWADVAEIFSPWSPSPTYTIMPGDVVLAHAVFYPSAIGNYSDEVMISTSIGEQRIVLKGNAIDAPKLTVSKTPIVVNLNASSETADQSLAFDNALGQSDLEYAISVEYARAATTQTSSTTTTNGIGKITPRATKASVSSGARTQATYHRTISHTTKTIPDTFIGSGGTAPITLGIKFNAGPDGFNLSHIETWLRTESLTTGAIEVTIKAGGNSIGSATTLTTGRVNFQGTGSDASGKFYQVKMDKPARIYPNEDFYATVTYPFGIAYPQGSITDSEVIANRYSYYDDETGLWGDIQKVPGLSQIGWLIVAAEETAGTTSWLKVTSATEGKLAMGEASQADLHFDGAAVEPGDNVAKLVFTSNDPKATTVKIPVTLHMNNGPLFTGDRNIIMAEMDTLTLVYDVKDVEGQTYTISPAATYKGVSYTLADNKLTVTLTPGYSDAGNYTYVFKATDQLNATTELTLAVEVMGTNQAPTYVAADETKTLEYNSIGRLFEYSLSEFFADPDEDEVTFSVVNGNPAIADLFVSDNQFMVRPLAMGKTTLAFTITDSHYAVLQDTINLVVNNILGLEEAGNSSVKVYPNPVQQFARIFLSYEWKGVVNLEIVDAAGKQHLVQEVDATKSHDIQLNVSNLQKGFYVLRAASADKRISVKLIKE